LAGEGFKQARVSIPSFHLDLRQAPPLLYEILDRRWGICREDCAFLRKSMAKYRHDLPHRHGGTFLTDGGQITELIFHDGIDLPHLAAFTLLESEAGRERLRKYYESYLDIARLHGVGFVLSGPTWRANPDWAQKLGYDAAALDAINKDSISFLEDLRATWEASCDSSQMPCVISGVIGPRGDGYKAGIMMDADEAEAYHNAQIASFVDSQADMVSAFTLTNIDEAIGIVRAAEKKKMPCAISFTVETDGRLPRGETLQQAIETVDHETNGVAEYFMINCAHPSHFEQALDSRAAWTKRICGIRANASTRSHAELDESETLDDGDPEDLGLRYRKLKTAFPAMRIIGGCCGTDHRHVAAIAAACLPVDVED
jgi:homocysteine S-methyltransferase